MQVIDQLLALDYNWKGEEATGWPFVCSIWLPYPCPYHLQTMQMLIYLVTLTAVTFIRK
jgi:hypothetical protein